MTAWSHLRSDGRIVAGVDIAPMTTYKLGGRARWFSQPGSLDTLREVVEAAAERGLETVVLGRGSNLVVSDLGYEGLVIRLAGNFRTISIDRRHGLVTAGAAVPLPVLARKAGKAGLGAVEFYVGIPGSVGGAVTMNAGFYGTETSEVLVSASILETRSRSVRLRVASDLAFSYRTSNVEPDDVVLEATYSVRARSPEQVSNLMREAIRWRRDNQPGGTTNAGSIFRNPPGDAAGRIIDSLGLKGMRRGGARVSYRHANFFVTESGARAQDVHDLVGAVRRRVHEHTGIQLQTEVRFVGQFSGIHDLVGDRAGSGARS